MTTPSVEDPPSSPDRDGGWTLYALGCAGLIVTAVLWRLFTVSQWSWYGDDWVYVSEASRAPLGEYLFQNYNGHLMPLQFLVVYAITHLAPLHYAAAVLVTVLTIAASLTAWAVFFRELFGPRTRLLLPFAVLSLSPIFLAPSLWFAAALQVFGLQLAMGLCLLATVRVLRQPRDLRRHVALSAAFVLGLLIWQKSLLITIPMVLLVLMTSHGTVVQRVRRGVVALIGPIALTVAYIPLYLLATRTPDSANTQLFVDRSIGASVSFYTEAVLNMVIPSLLGGPWTSLGNVQASFSGGRGAMTLLGLFLGVLATLAVLSLRRGGGWILAILGLYILVSWGLVLTSSRYDLVQNYAARDSRYAADVIPVLCLAVATAMTPLIGERREGWLLRTDIARLRPRMPVIGLGAGAALILSMAVGNGLGWDSMAATSPKPWVDAMRSSAIAADGATLYNSHAPLNVFHPGFNPTESTLSYMLAPLPGTRHFNLPTENMLVDDQRGHLRTMRVEPAATSGPPQQEGCGFLVTSEAPTRIDLTQGLHPWEWAVEVRYFTDAAGLIAVEIGDGRWDIPVLPGLRRSQFIVVQGADHVTISAYPGTPTLCVTDVVLGTPVAEPPA